MLVARVAAAALPLLHWHDPPGGFLETLSIHDVFCDILADTKVV
jgi:hypothetical protein